MRETYAIFDGRNLSFLSDEQTFSGSLTVIDPVQITHERALDFFHMNESGLFCISRGEYVTVQSDFVLFCTSRQEVHSLFAMILISGPNLESEKAGESWAVPVNEVEHTICILRHLVWERQITRRMK